MTHVSGRLLLGGLLLVAACGDDALPIDDTENGSTGGDESTSGTPTTTPPPTTMTTMGSTSDDASSGDESGTAGDACGNDMLDGDEQCDGTDLGGEDCISQGFDGGDLGCAADCTFDPRGCTMRTCGNGMLDGNEACDGDELNGLDCVTAGFDSGTLACDASCTIYDTTGCGNCGNETIDGDEVCDLTDLGVEDCTTQGFAFGELGCAADCTSLDTAGCYDQICGNGTIEGTEDCEGAELGGADCFSEGLVGDGLACAADCSFDTSSCVVPTGDCCAANGTPGCDDAACTTTVCDQDPFCCATQWDGLCGGVAQGACAICGGGTGDCCAANATNGCDDPACVMELCGFEGQGLSVDCCESPWDQLCADAAALNCQVCLLPSCGNDLVDDPAEACDGVDLDGQTCLTQGFDSGTIACGPVCSFDTSGCGLCGNDVIEGTEVCDGTDTGAATCVSEGFDSGALGCDAVCGAVDTSSCGTCGNGVADGAEPCDGADLGGETCASLGLQGGTLDCTPGCGYDTSLCTIPGLAFGSDSGYTGLELPPGAFACDDISATGTPLGLLDDDVGVAPMGFSFPVYGVDFTDVTINSNGTMRWGDNLQLTYLNTCLPSNELRNTNNLYVFWDDLNPTLGAGEVYYETLGVAGDQRFVVQWDVANFDGDPLDLMRFQVMLHEATGEIDVCYPDTINAGNTADGGAEATAGIQQDGVNALQYSCNTPDLVDGLLLRYMPL